MGKHIRFFLEQSWLLLVASVFFGICLAGLNAWWQPKIIANEIKKFNDLAGAMLTEAEQFEPAAVLTIDIGKGKTVDTEISSNETPGFGDKIKTEDFFANQFIGAPAGEFTLSKTGDDKKIDSEIVAITGATVTSESVVKILNNFIGQVKTRMKEKGYI